MHALFKDSQKFFMQPSPLYTSYLFSTPSKFHIVDTEYSQIIYLSNFVVDDLLQLLLFPFIILIKDSRSS